MPASRTTMAFLVLPVAICAAAAAASDARGSKRHRAYDALAEAGHVARPVERRELLKGGREAQMEERLGVPTFLWAGKPGPEVAWDGRGKQAPEAAARRHLAAYGALYGLQAEDVASARLASVHDTGRGPVIVKFRQELDGIAVFRDELSIVMDRQLRVVALSGYLPGKDLLAAGLSGFALSPEEAVGRALSDFTAPDAPLAVVAVEEVAQADAAVAQAETGGYQRYELTPSAKTPAAGAQLVLTQPARTKPVFFHLPEGLEPAYYVEVDGQVAGEEGPDSAALSYVISAIDGRVLFRHDLTVADSYAYRVWADTDGAKAPFDSPNGTAGTPHPTGIPDGFQPAFVRPNLVTLENGPISTNDPWLPAGAVETRGNNVDAYADLVAPDGLSAGDFRAGISALNTFDYTYDTSLAPGGSVAQRMASVTQLFYVNNYLHDWFYDAGFDEASGNAQDDNYGRGGLGGDSLRAEAQDFNGLNNANMSTPADGSSPRMQMYVFTGPGTQAITANTPASISGNYPVGVASGFGAQIFNVTAEVVWVDDGVVGAGGTIRDGCETPFANAAAVAGKIAFIDRGGPCPGGFLTKAQNAAANGAVGVIIANIATSNNPTAAPGMGGVGVVSPLIGVLSLNLANGNLFRAQFGLDTVNATLSRPAVINRDGTIDNQVVAHEWGHYISNRLVGNSSGLSNQQGRGMGEGWGDFHALLMTVRPEDALHLANADFNGVYPIVGYAMAGLVPQQSHYFGIRRMPYSTDITKNPLTFKHISNGVPLPGGVPILFGADGANNAEVHNTGEIWATMLWESYAALLRDTLGPSPRLSFDQAHERMREYLVAAYKLTPNAPTFLEARDALLVAAYANDPVDFGLFCEAFAKRGAGIRAVAPDRFSVDNQGVVESFVCGNDLAFLSATLQETASCDQDGVLDNAEVGQLTVTLRNVGLGPLSQTTAAVTSTNPHVTIVGGAISFPPSEPFGTTTGSVAVEVSGAVGIEVLDLEITFEDPDLAIAGPVSATFSARINSDVVPDSSATDDVESGLSAWTIAGDPTLSGAFPWRRLEASVTDHRWFGPNAGATSDQYLVSPVLQVGNTGNFGFTFRHRYSFEQPVFDGGVIEISTDGGGTWTDVGASVYNGTLDPSGSNPLRGRPAFVNISAGYPAFLQATVNLGSAYDGQAVQVRFRGGADVNTAAVGWEIDDIAFLGITNTPFASLVPHRAICDCPSIALAPASLPASGRNVPYPPTILTPTAGAGPFTFAVSGLPAGMSPALTVTGDDVTIAGTPTVDFNGTVTVSGGDRFACPFNQNYALSIGPPTISINDISVREGNSFLTPGVMTLSLSHASAVAVWVRISTVDGSAKHGQDYVKLKELPVFVPASKTAIPLVMLVKGDKKVEADETFRVRLSRPLNGLLGADVKGVVTILNDDNKKPRGWEDYDGGGR